MATLDSSGASFSKRWVWIGVGEIALVAGIPVLFLLQYGGVATLHDWSAPVISLPPLYVRVLDGATGTPIAGARVMRGYYREGGAKGFDSSSAEGVPGSLARATTDAEGNTVLPGTEKDNPSDIRGLTGMSWVVFKPAWMPASACYWEGPMRPGGCSGFGGMVFNDFWYRPKFDRYLDELDLEVRVIAPPGMDAPTVTFDKGGQITNVPPRLFDDNRNPVELDPWGDCLRRLNVLVDRHYLTLDDFVTEAVAYTRQREPTERIIKELDVPQNHTGFIDRSGRHAQVQQGLTLLRLERQYCNTHPRSPFCRRGQSDLDWRLSFFKEAEAGR